MKVFSILTAVWEVSFIFRKTRNLLLFFRKKLEDELELLSAEARIRGMHLEDFLSLCSKVFVEMEVAVE